jgi:hypothetical protein
VEHNCSVKTVDDFLPMILLDSDRYWPGAPVVRQVNLADGISPIFKRSPDPSIRAACTKRVQFTTDLAGIRRVLGAGVRRPRPSCR